MPVQLHGDPTSIQTERGRQVPHGPGRLHQRPVRSTLGTSLTVMLINSKNQENVRTLLLDLDQM